LGFPIEFSDLTQDEIKIKKATKNADFNGYIKDENITQE
tara:strand:+ start:65 stop:181 length:117 start_codon:yes stop_codon:yes gene_type:complete